MSWIRDGALSRAQRLCIEVVKCGRIPRHIAFIMDGNRRFAEKNKIGKGQGHSKGFDRLAEVLQWCLDLGVPQVTVYAFSIENFKRSKEELDALMALAEEKFARLLEEKDLLAERGIRVRVVGRISSLSANLRSLIAEATLLTERNDRATLNVAFAYTGRDEIASAVADIVSGVRKGLIDPEDVSEELMDETLQLSAPDLLIRTSGEVRLSDFMIWQVSDTCLYFTDVLWPEFKIWHLLAAIVHFQRVYPDRLPAVRGDNPKRKAFLDYIEEEKRKTLKAYASAC